MIKLIVCDFDGTILDRKSQLIYPANAEAIRKAGAAGITFCAATGRNAPAAREILNGSGVEGWLIALNGGELRDPAGCCIAAQTLEAQKITAILSDVSDPRVLTTLYGAEIKYTFLDLNEHYRRYLEIPGSGKTAENFPFSRFAAGYRRIAGLEDIQEPIFKIEMRSDDLKALHRMKTRLELWPGLQLTSAFSHNLELLSKTCSKASALYKLVDQLKLKQDEIAIFGDDLNDLCLFEQFPESYAVANAKPEILARARYHIPSCEECGPAQAILKLAAG